jgi:hypothetical protein
MSFETCHKMLHGVDGIGLVDKWKSRLAAIMVSLLIDFYIFTFLNSFFFSLPFYDLLAH